MDRTGKPCEHKRAKRVKGNTLIPSNIILERMLNGFNKDKDRFDLTVTLPQTLWQIV